MEVTREEYLDALEKIDYYHRNVSGKETKECRDDIKLSDWFNEYKGKFSARLRHSIEDYIFHSNKDNPTVWDGRSTFSQYLQDVSWDEFRAIRNAGRKTFTEFEEFREQYYSDIQK